MKWMKNIRYWSVLVGIVLLLAGCQGDEETSDVRYFYNSMNTTRDENMEESSDQGELYLILSINSAEQVMRVYRYANGIEYQYYYGLGTEFRDKYGKHVSVAGFSVGDVVSISSMNTYEKITLVQKSGDVWVYDNITRFKIDEGKGILTIGDKHYRIKNQTFLFSEDKRILLDEISDNDTLSVVGKDKDVLSISVTTGHGYLRLRNTKLFEGSYLQLDTKIFSEIEPSMELEVEEGVYTLAVANNGWGGSTEVTVARGETTYVDLDELKGEGPKKGKIQFGVDVEGAEIYVDNKKIDYSGPVELQYGAHYLVVVADGYDTWSRTLYVNSEEGTILIGLTDNDNSVATGEMTAQQPENAPEAPEAPEAAETNNNNGNDGNNSNDSNNDNSTSSGGDNSVGSNTSLTDQQLQDYLSTITTLLKGFSS